MTDYTNPSAIVELRSMETADPKLRALGYQVHTCFRAVNNA